MKFDSETVPPKTTHPVRVGGSALHINIILCGLVVHTMHDYPEPFLVRRLAELNAFFVVAPWKAIKMFPSSAAETPLYKGDL